MILGFNKDEGLHVIIDLLMDPTNDTNFRQVTLWNEWNYYFLAQGARKLGNPWTQNAFWPARGRSHRRCGCACRCGGFLYFLAFFYFLILMLLLVVVVWWLNLLLSSFPLVAILSISTGGRVLPGTRWIRELWLRARPGWGKQRSESCLFNKMMKRKISLWLRDFIGKLGTYSNKFVKQIN